MVYKMYFKIENMINNWFDGAQTQNMRQQQTVHQTGHQ